MKTKPGVEVPASNLYTNAPLPFTVMAPVRLMVTGHAPEYVAWSALNEAPVTRLPEFPGVGEENTTVPFIGDETLICTKIGWLALDPTPNNWPASFFSIQKLVYKPVIFGAVNGTEMSTVLPAGTSNGTETD